MSTVLRVNRLPEKGIGVTRGHLPILSIMNGERAASPFGARLPMAGSPRYQPTGPGCEVGIHTTAPVIPRHPSRPGRQMVLRLGEALGVSLRERNQLLRDAGLPPAYPQAGLGGHDLAPYRAALDRLLHTHLPYPAIVVDNHWTVLLAPPCRVGADDVGAVQPGAGGVSGCPDRRGRPAGHRELAEVAWAGLGSVLPPLLSRRLHRGHRSVDALYASCGDARAPLLHTDCYVRWLTEPAAVIT